MTLKYKAVIFDLDGTLVDSLFDLGSSMNKVLISYNYPIHAMDKYRHFVGNGMLKLVERALPDQVKHDVSTYFDALIKTYFENCLIKTQPYSGILQLLRTLTNNGVQMAIVTNKKHELTDKVIDGLLGEFTFVERVGDMNDGHRKPDPFHTCSVIEKMGVEKSEVLFVGDSNVDIETAHNAGIDSCGVLWGFRTEAELIEQGATYIAKNPAQIFEIIH